MASHTDLGIDLAYDQRAAACDPVASAQLLGEFGTDLIAQLDPQGRIEWISPSVQRLLGHAPGHCLGHALVELVHVNDRRLFASLLDRANRDPATGSLRLARADGSLVWVAVRVQQRPDTAGVPPALVCIAQDVSEHRRIEEDLARAAREDALTGLPNRLRLSERIDASILRASRRGGRFALVLFDLDRFKYVNDSLGHGAGDQLLVEIGQRLSATLDSTDLLARWGGDEFVLLTTGVLETTEVMQRATACLEALGRPHRLQSRQIHVGASAGIAMYPDHGRNQAELLRHADLAMYSAKEAGPGSIVCFSDDLAARAHRRLAIESDLHEALAAAAAGQSPFELRHQPIVDAATGHIQGIEALVRWRHDGHLVGPDLFIPIAEDSGLIVPLGTWVLHAACAFAQQLIATGQAPADFYVSVNVSARQFREQDFPGLVRATLATTGLAAHQLQIELTESAIMASPDRAAATMQAIRTLGVQIAIDDFGTGYSSLAYLARFPANGLKIDKSFVRAMESGAGAAIVKATVAIANELGMKITAEGVETTAQRERLTACGCQRLQGYLFDKPLMAEELTARLARLAAA